MLTVSVRGNRSPHPLAQLPSTVRTPFPHPHHTSISPYKSKSSSYPACATPLPTLVPTLPYGDAQEASDLSLSNSLYYLNTPEGTSAESCCKTCFFEIPYCVQAYWYFYQGCVVSQATVLGSANGVQSSSTCPSGLLGALTYAKDTNPAFRSTGNFAGPCGVEYANV